MAGTGIRSVIDKKFIGNLTAAAKQAFGSSSGRGILSGQSSNVSLSSSLRYGAQAYAVGVANLNNTISFANLAKSDLERIGEITEKMVSLAKEATTRGVGDQGRRSLDRRFRTLVEDFKKIVDSSVIGDSNYLKTEGLAEIFVGVGLDKDTSQSIAQIFERFLTPEEDTTLASEYIKGKRPYQIPSKAYTSRPSDSAYQLTQISNSGVSGNAGISTVNSVYGDVDDILNQNPGRDAVFTRSINGTTTTVPSGQLNQDGDPFTVLAVNETTGYSIITSRNDPLGFNVNNYEQLFLVDEVGTIVSQITNSLSDNYTYSSADMSEDDLQYSFSMYDGAVNSVEYLAVPSLGEDPSGYILKNITSSATDVYSNVKVNNSGGYLAYLQDSGGTKSIGFSDNLGAIDATLLSFGNSDAALFGFLDDGYLVIADPTGGGNYSILGYAYGNGVYDDIGGPTADLAHLTALESSGAGYYGYFSDDQVHVWQRDVSELITLDVSGNTISGLSLAVRAGATAPATGIDIGILGNLSTFSGDSDTELYRYSFNTQSTTGRRSAVGSGEVDRLFSPLSNLRSRPAAYRALNDLEALQKQITENVSALDYAMEIIKKNVELVRETGLALLDISGSIDAKASPEDVARLLRDKIRKNAVAALSQAENLEPITVAALTLSSGGN